MISVSVQALLAFGETLGIKPEEWRRDHEHETLDEISIRQASVTVVDPARTISAAAALRDAYGAALGLSCLTLGDWKGREEDDRDLSPFPRQGGVSLLDRGQLAALLGDPDLDHVRLSLTLELDKNRLVRDWLLQAGYPIPPLLMPRLVFFRETLAALFLDSLEGIAKWCAPEAPGKVILLCCECSWLLDGPYLAVGGGNDLLAVWKRAMPKQLSGEPSTPDALSPTGLREACAKSLNWPIGELIPLTPLHLELEGDVPADDVVANAIRVQTLNLCVFYTADQIDWLQDEDGKAGKWKRWIATYRGACDEVQVKAATADQKLGQKGVTSAGTMIEAVKWCYEGFSTGDKLSFFQGLTARSLRQSGSAAAFDTLVQEAESLWKQIVPNWKMFVEGKLDDFDEQVRSLEDYVASTVQSFSDQISAQIKGLSDAMLASVAALFGAFLATFISKEVTPQILRVAVAVYIIYLLIFPLTYSMLERWGSYRALVRQYEGRLIRFRNGLSDAKVESIVGDHVTLSQGRFLRWFWLVVATYLVVAIVLWFLVPTLGSSLPKAK